MGQTSTNAKGYALITGGSSGIGEAMAHYFAADGIPIVLVARSESELQRVATDLKAQYNVDVRIKSLDLAESSASQQLYDWTQTEGVSVEYLINNAGFGDRADVVEADSTRLQGMIGLNIEALVLLSKMYGADMSKVGRGNIVNLASWAGFVPGPGMAVYYASKAFVLSFSQALHGELEAKGVIVTAVRPGPTATRFAQSAHAEGTSMFGGKLPSAAMIGEFAYRAMRKGELVAIWGGRYRMAFKFVSLIPRRALVDRMRSRAE